MTNHQGLPEPFYDDEGFPLPFRHIQAEVQSRGGRITGSGLTWSIMHPSPGLPNIRIEITSDGEVLLDAGNDLVMDVFCDEAWRVDQIRSWTHLEDVLLGFIEGGFTREVWRDKEGAIVQFRMRLKGSRVDEAGGTAGSMDEAEARKTRSTYPAWPLARPVDGP